MSDVPNLYTSSMCYTIIYDVTTRIFAKIPRLFFGITGSNRHTKKRTRYDRMVAFIILLYSHVHSCSKPSPSVHIIYLMSVESVSEKKSTLGMPTAPGPQDQGIHVFPGAGKSIMNFNE